MIFVNSYRNTKNNADIQSRRKALIRFREEGEKVKWRALVGFGGVDMTVLNFVCFLPVDGEWRTRIEDQDRIKEFDSVAKSVTTQVKIHLKVKISLKIDKDHVIPCLI